LIKNVLFKNARMPKEKPVSKKNSSWFQNITSCSNPKHILVCFPYAGGGASVFSEWKELENGNIDVWALSMPGRERRFHEKPYDSLNLLIDGFLPEFLSITSDKSYSIFGHSMGAQIAYELTTLLEGRRLNPPSHLFLSGRRPPHLTRQDPKYHTLPDEELIQKLIELGGISTEVMQYPELISFALPSIRADFKIIETIKNFDVQPLNLPISVFAGADDDRASPQEVAEWNSYTNDRFEEHTLDGGHFFLASAQDELWAALKGALQS
jgi:surfactin synthase thioesterase subunit